MKYYIKSLGETAEDAREIPKSEDTFMWSFAEAAAKEFYHNRYGHEHTWPIVFTIIWTDKSEVDYEVDIAFAFTAVPV